MLRNYFMACLKKSRTPALYAGALRHLFMILILNGQRIVVLARKSAGT